MDPSVEEQLLKSGDENQTQKLLLEDKNQYEDEILKMVPKGNTNEEE